MGEVMIRKQLYLPKRLNQFLKRAARQRGISESEVIRQALERDESAASYPVRESEAAWNEILRYVNERKAEYGDEGNLSIGTVRNCMMSQRRGNNRCRPFWWTPMC